MAREGEQQLSSLGHCQRKKNQKITGLTPIPIFDYLGILGGVSLWLIVSSVSTQSVQSVIDSRLSVGNSAVQAEVPPHVCSETKWQCVTLATKKLVRLQQKITEMCSVYNLLM